MAMISGISYNVHGDGPPLLLLRGLGRTVGHWLGYERDVLARSFKVITLDLRGIGASTAACGWTVSIFDMADDVVTVLNHLKIDAAHIMGISLGGMITLAMGLKHPKRCLSLVVVNTSIAGQRVLRITPAALRAMGAGLLASGEQFHVGLVDALVGSECPAERRAEIARQYYEMALVEGLYGVTVLKQLLAAGRFLVKHRLKDMRVPTLVVYGTGDRFVPNSNSRKLVQNLPVAKLVSILGGGHELSLDKPEELAQAVRDWTEELAQAQMRKAPAS